MWRVVRRTSVAGAYAEGRMARRPMRIGGVLVLAERLILATIAKM